MKQNFLQTMANERLNALLGTCRGSKDLLDHPARPELLVLMEVLLEEASASHNKAQ